MKRTDRLNSLLKEVISEVIMTEVRNPKISSILTVTKVAVTKDLRQAKVYFSVLGSALEQKQTLKALHSAAGFISIQAAQRVELRYFPTLEFYLDDTLDHEIRIHHLLEKIYDKDSERFDTTEDTERDSIS